MHKQGIIEPSNAPYATPTCPVKKDGTIRMCVDYRQLTDKTISDSFLAGNVNDSIESMVGAKYFRSIDLAQGCHEVPVEEMDQPSDLPRGCGSSHACHSA